jgi:hypothetical protein
LAQASVVVGRGSALQAGGFLWIDDANVRELLRTRRQTADLFIDPSPPGGLLLQANVDFDRLVRRCRALGVEVTIEGPVVRSRATVPPPSSAPISVGRRSSTRFPRETE